MINAIYNSKILNYAANIEKIGRLQQPDASATKHSKLCGSTITVDINLKNDTITDFAQEVQACALGQAAASLLAQHIIGMKTQEIRVLHTLILQMLKEGGPAPKRKFAEFALLQPIKDYKARHASTLLVFAAVIDCLNQIKASKNAKMQ